MLGYINKITAILLCIAFLSSCEDSTPVSDITQFPRITAEDVVVEEDADDTFGKISLSWAYTSEVTVDYVVRTLDIDTIVTAKVGEDFNSTSGTVVFAPGETEKLVDIDLLADPISEDNESIELFISNAQLGVIIKSSGRVLVMDDDADFFVDDSGPTSPTSYQGLDLVWEEQFDGSTIDSDIWTHEIGNSGWGNNELQFYTDSPRNSFQAGGYLVIEALEESMGGSDYTSARMITEGKKEFKYGRIDIRAKLPTGRGLWPALWMLGADFRTVGWPSCGEIDIMELVGNQPNIVHGTAHWGPNPANRQFKGSQSFLIGETFNDQFHVYSIFWKENEIRWYRDGEEYFRLTPADVGNNEWPFNDDFFLIFNVAVGGDWPGSPDATTQFPQRMIVDYIRVFQ